MRNFEESYLYTEVPKKSNYLQLKKCTYTTIFNFLKQTEINSETADARHMNKSRKCDKVFFFWRGGQPHEIREYYVIFLQKNGYQV